MREMEDLIFMVNYEDFRRIFEKFYTASKQPLRLDLTSDLKSVTLITYIYMCILPLWLEPFLTASEATTALETTTASEVKSDIRFEISDLNCIHICVHVAYMAPLVTSEVTTASEFKPPT